MQTIVKDMRNALVSEPMDENLTKLFTRATLGELEGDDRLFTAEDAAYTGFIGQIIQKRLEAMSPNTKVSLGVGLIATFNSNGIPGRAVFWAYTLHRMARERSYAKVTMETLAEAFPMGFPDEESFALLWDEQKTKPEQGLTDNLLDRKETWL